MKIDMELGNRTRKELVTTIGGILDIKPKYQGTPTFSYQIGDLEIDREGSLVYSAATEEETAGVLLEQLKAQGFIPKVTNNSTAANEGNINELVIEIPKEGFTEMALTNLEKLVKSKEPLIKKALDADNLQIKYTDKTIQFPWFEAELDEEKVHAYTHFISALCGMAKTQKRVTATKKQVQNEKYAFRCFLLRLGFIGDEFKTARKILLSNLSGSSAFKKENLATPKADES